MRSPRPIKPFRGRSALKYGLAGVIGLAVLTFAYSMGLQASRQLEERHHAGLLSHPATEAGAASGVYHWGDSRDLDMKNWRGRAGSGEPAVAPSQRQRLAVLLPCWADCAQASILLLYLSSLLRQQGIPFRIHVLEQAGGGPFNPGLLANVGFRVAMQTDAVFVPDYIAVQQPALTPLVNVSFAFPSSPFLHLASEQALFNWALPYDAYCGGAWLAGVDFFQRAGGLSNAYVGYEGLEDDFCRRALAKLGGSAAAIPRPGPGSGRFTNSEDAALEELAAAYREQNRQTFSARWGDNLTAPVELSPEKEGLASIPQNWPQLVRAVQQGEAHGWWRVQLPGTSSRR